MKTEVTKQKYSFMQLLLTVVSICCLLISNIITAKQMALPFGITMTCAVVIFPVTYILSDVFSEVYGYKWSRITCYMGFAMNVLMVLVFEFTIATPAPSYWGNQEAFVTVLGSAPRTLIASLTAYVAGDFINDRVFQKMKEKHKDSTKGFGLRAIVSSFAGEVTDSLIFIPLAFIGQMPLATLAQMLVVQVSLKTAYEILVVPITTLVVKKVSAYEQRA